MARVLLLATTTGYQVRAFGQAAEKLGVDVVFATDRCHQLDDPWRDAAVPIRFYDEPGSAAAILDAARHRPIDGVLALGDRPATIAALVLQWLGLPGNPPEAASAARNKLLARERFQAAGLPTPWFTRISVASRKAAPTVAFPCVVKPLGLSGSRGVMRANDAAELESCLFRLRAILDAPDVRGERNPLHDTALIEEFIPGREFALEGVLERGTLHVLAIFDKPDPLDGPFFEETIYVTPSRADAAVQQSLVAGVTRAAAALGLSHGPIHAECRVNECGVFVLEVAPRPIGGLCARVLRFEEDGRPPVVGLDELLLRHALGESPARWTREPEAAGVMMIPIPRRGVFRGVEGLDAARQLDGIEDVRITAKPDQVLVPLPEGASYLGFIFSRASAPEIAERALRQAHGCLRFAIDPEMPMLQSRHG